MTVQPPIQGFAEAARAVTAAGQRFELVTVSVRGQSYPAFKAAPPTLGQLFSAARQHQDQTFVVYESERWTFGQVLGQADALGAALIRRYGVRHGDRVAIAMRNYPEWIVAFAAITSIGAVSVSLNAWGTEPELDFALVDSGARLLIADGPRIRRTAQTRRRLGIRARAWTTGPTFSRLRPVHSQQTCAPTTTPLSSTHRELPDGPRALYLRTGRLSRPFSGSPAGRRSTCSGARRSPSPPGSA
jgi:acyl-CoA synthetase (AMP-forming)/AMP-acid ligase II